MQSELEDLVPGSAAADLAAPTHSSPKTPARIQSLDVLRGIAVLGGLGVSIWLFGGFTANQKLQLLQVHKGYNYGMFSTISLLLEGKMLSLICLVFGAGAVLYMQKKQEGKLQPADLFIRRQLWLLAFGLLNALLFLWSGDILFHLAILGILIFPFTRMRARGLVIAGFIAALFFTGKIYWQHADHQSIYAKYVAVLNAEKKIKKDSALRAKEAPKKDAAIAGNAKPALSKDTTKAAIAAIKKDTLTAKQVREKQAWEGLVKSTKYDPKADEGTFKNMRKEKFGEVYDHVLPSIQQKEAQWTYNTGIWDMSSLMLIGMAMFKFGFFNRRWKTSSYLVLSIVGIGLGLALAWVRLYLHQQEILDFEKYIQRYPIPHNLLVPFEKILMVLGYASLVLLLLNTAIFRTVFSAFAAVGKLALSNYLFQSIACLLIFTGYGMGYFGRLEQYQLYLVVFEIWIIQIVFSVFWLKVFTYGPAEWLWRCLVYARWMPIRESKAFATIEHNPAIL